MQPETRLTVRLHEPGERIANLVVEELPVPEPAAGEVLVRVYAAAITREELTWPVDRLPAIPSYEVSGVVAALGAGVDTSALGDEVYGLTPFDRDGVAASFAIVPADVLAPKPSSLGHVESAALPMPGLTAWQGLFTHGGLTEGTRVLIHGAAGGVGHIATQLAVSRGAVVIGTARGDGVAVARKLGASEVVDTATTDLAGEVGPVDLVFDTVGGDLLAQSSALLAPGGRLVAVAEEPPDDVEGTFFIVEPNADQLVALARLADEGTITPTIDSTFPLADAAKAFERVAASNKHGKVVLEVAS